MNATKQVILQKYGVSPNELIRKGMEAEVYAIGTDAVLKLYIGTTNFAYLSTLQNFYVSLSQFTLSYSFPYIQTVATEGDICISIERQLSGTRMSAILPTLTKEQMDSMMRIYLDAALELSTIQIPSDFDRYKLFDAEGISHRTKGDWHQFLTCYLTQKGLEPEQVILLTDSKAIYLIINAIKMMADKIAIKFDVVSTLDELASLLRSSHCKQDFIQIYNECKFEKREALR